MVMDVPPDVPPQYAPVVIAEAKQAAQPSTERTIGVCKLIENRPEARFTAVNTMSPVLGVYGYLTDYEKAVIDVATYKAAKITLLQAPKHGTLVTDNEGAVYYPDDYPVDSNYVGPDRATLLVEIGKYKVKVIYHFNVMPNVPGSGEQGRPTDDKRFCPNGRVWKISLNPDDPNAPIYTFEHPSELTSPYAGLSNVNLTFGTLAGGALGQPPATPSPSTPAPPATACSSAEVRNGRRSKVTSVKKYAPPAIRTRL